MDNLFEIPVMYRGKEHIFHAALVTTAYSYRLDVDVFGKMVSFEPDEERNFRALVSPVDLQGSDMPDKHLLEEITNQLVLLFKD